MKTNIVRHKAGSLPPLSDEQRLHLKRLAGQPDQDIDLSDIPELTDAQLRSGMRGRFYRPVKEQITTRVDSDVMAWLKAQGKGYQSRMNEILRREMLASLKKHAR